VVAPSYRRRGLGWVRAGPVRLRKLGATRCVLAGAPNYYSRFGCRSDPPKENEQVEPEDGDNSGDTNGEPDNGGNGAPVTGDPPSDGDEQPAGSETGPAGKDSAESAIEPETGALGDEEAGSQKADRQDRAASQEVVDPTRFKSWKGVDIEE